MWVHDDLVQAEELLDSLRIALSRTEVAPTDQTILDIANALANDLDTPNSINLLREWLTATDAGQVGGHPGELSRAIDTLLGVAF